MKHGYLLAALFLCPMLAQADIYKAVDEDGHVTYSSTPIKGGKKLILEPLPTMMPPGKAQASANFPKVDNQTQKGRDETRRKILQDELDAEQKQLEEAQLNLKNASPEIYKTQDGKTFRNVPKYDEKVKQLNADIELHQQNIAALKTELSKLP